jgi:hypothetical protein
VVLPRPLDGQDSLRTIELHLAHDPKAALACRPSIRVRYLLERAGGGTVDGRCVHEGSIVSIRQRSFRGRRGVVEAAWAEWYHVRRAAE